MEDTSRIQRPSVCFDVQKIIGVSVGNGNVKNYQVQWAPTWVSGFHLVGCEHLIEDFLDQQCENDQDVDDDTTTGVRETHDVNENVLIRDDVPQSTASQQSTDDVTVLTSAQHSRDESMAVKDEHFLESEESNSCLYSNNSNDSENVKGGANKETNVSNEDTCTSDGSNSANFNFVWVKVENMHNNDDTQENNSMHSDNDDSTDNVGGEGQHRKPNQEFDNEFQNNVLEVKMGEMSEAETENQSNENKINLAEPTSANLTRHMRILSESDDEFETNVLEIEREEMMSEVAEIESGSGRSGSNENTIYVALHTLQPTVQMVNKCEICNITFKQKNDLTRHLLLHTGQNNYPCKDVNKSFPQDDTLEKHSTLHTSDKSFICRVCNKTFKENYLLTRHLRTQTHINKSFPQDDTLEKHSTLHTADKSYICDKCNMTFKEKYQLTRHLRTEMHTGEKPFKCTECNKCFSLQPNLKRHFRLHTGEKPYKCLKCDRTFSDGTNCKRHSELCIGPET